MISEAEKKVILQKYDGLIRREARKYSSFLPYEVVLAEAYKIAHEALDRYDPKKGIQLSTFLTSTLRKLNRLSTQYGGFVRLPEDQIYKLKKLQDAEQELRDYYGRDPTNEELADKLHWPLAEVIQLRTKNISEVNLSNLEYTPTFTNSANDSWIHYVYHSLGDQDKLILEHLVGLNGKSPMKATDLAKKLKVSPSFISKRIKIISDELRRGWEVFGTFEQ